MKRRLAFGALFAAVICAPVQAQETGTLIQHRAAQAEYRGKKAARVTMEQFAACLVSRSRGRVTRYANMRADDPGYRKYMLSLFHSMGDECLSSGDLAFNDIVFRGTVFQALYAVDFPSSSAPTDFSALPSTGFREAYGPQVAPEARSVVALEQFGECVGRADGAGLRNLLNAIPGSAQESALFNALVPKFSACIPKGETLAFSKVILKGALAEGMYWLSKATEPGAQATR
jgi:hypothetical protein